MEESKIDSLVNKRNIDKKFAKLLLIFTGGDEEAALKIIDSIDKDIAVIKLKASCNLNNIYVDMVLFYNRKICNIEDSSFILITKDASAFNINIKDDYQNVIETIENLRLSLLHENKMETELFEFIKSYVKNGNFKIYDDIKYMSDKKFEEKQIILFTNIFEKFFGETNVIVKIDLQNIDIFSMIKCKNKYFDEEIEREDLSENSDEKNKNNISNDTKGINIIQLECEPFYSPVRGSSISLFNVGDSIKVKIIDQREIATFLTKLMNGIDENGNFQPILAKILSKEKLDDDLYKIIVEFGPGITGKLICGTDIKVDGEYANIDYSKINKPTKNIKSRGLNLSTGFIFIAIIILIIALVILILLS
ncbi:MAG: DUF4899 domain-containing protein [Spirochaetes bacterium]|nr:DUF4899 domain-containing protein [Spirochaetota bacterium]